MLRGPIVKSSRFPACCWRSVPHLRLQCAQISKHAGGIGLSIHHVRAANSYIRGTNGTSNGIVPMLRVYNNTARYVDQVRSLVIEFGSCVMIFR